MARNLLSLFHFLLACLLFFCLFILFHETDYVSLILLFISLLLSGILQMVVSCISYCRNTRSWLVMIYSHITSYILGVFFIGLSVHFEIVSAINTIHCGGFGSSGFYVPILIVLSVLLFSLTLISLSIYSREVELVKYVNQNLESCPASLRQLSSVIRKMLKYAIIFVVQIFVLHILVLTFDYELVDLILEFVSVDC